MKGRRWLIVVAITCVASAVALFVGTDLQLRWLPREEAGRAVSDRHESGEPRGAVAGLDESGICAGGAGAR